MRRCCLRCCLCGQRFGGPGDAAAQAGPAAVNRPALWVGGKRRPVGHRPLLGLQLAEVSNIAACGATRAGRSACCDWVDAQQLGAPTEPVGLLRALQHRTAPRSPDPAGPEVMERKLLLHRRAAHSTTLIVALSARALRWASFDDATFPNRAEMAVPLMAQRHTRGDSRATVSARCTRFFYAGMPMRSAINKS